MHDRMNRLAGVALLAMAIGLAGPAAADALNPLLDVLPQTDAKEIKAGDTKVPADELAADAASPAPRLVPFEDGTDRFELAGERDSVALTFSASAAEAGRAGRLVLAYKNAVSVLPDTAELAIELNGKDLGTLPVNQPFEAAPRRIDIPAGLVTFGRNVVRIRAIQHHRVDCSMDATYELWTRIDPARSGLETAAPATFSSPEDLVRVGRLDSGQTEIRLVLPATASAAMVNEALPLVQAVALYLNRPDIVVAIAQEPGTGPGIDLFAGSDDPATQTPSGLAILAEAPYGLSVRDGGEGRARVILKGSGAAEMRASLLAALKGPMAEGLASGVKAARDGVIAVEADNTYTLRQTGFKSTTFSGRLMRQRFNLVMPADFYPADYATLDLKLNAATAAGLLPSAQLLVRVNDRVVNSFPFRNTDGETFSSKKIELPLRAFRPGVNQVELLAELPIAADAACLPDSRKDDAARFILLDTTEIAVPPLARISRLPDLAAFAGKAWPYASGQPFAIHVADPDSQSVSAGLTLLARMSQSARSPLKVRLAFGTVPDTITESAVLLTSRDRGGDEAKPVEVSALFSVDREAALPGPVDPIATAGILSAPDLPARDQDDTDELLAAFHETALSNPGQSGFSSRLKAFMASAGNRFSRWLRYQGEDNATRMDPAEALVTMSQSAMPAGDGVLTVIAADDSRTLNVGMSRLASPLVWNRLDGGAAMIRRDTLELATWQAEDHGISAVTDWSPSNLRRILAAWSSDNFNIYVLSLIGLAMIFAAWLARIVPKLGARSTS